MRQVTHALLTRPPLSHSSIRRNQSASFDLHVLSTPPAFILSQDQTLVKSVCFQSRITTSNSFLTLLFLVHLQDVRLNFSLFRFCHRTVHALANKLLVHGASPNLRSHRLLEASFFIRCLLSSSQDLQKFSGVNSCHLLFNYQCSFVFALLRQLI